VLRWFARAGRHERADALDVARLRRRWRLLAGCLGFGIEGQDRAGLERLLRYCARPPFALERLEQLAHDQLVYRFPRTRTGERRWRKYWRQVEHTPGCATGCKLPIGISRIVVQLLRQESDRADGYGYGRTGVDRGQLDLVIEQMVSAYSKVPGNSWRVRKRGL